MGIRVISSVGVLVSLMAASPALAQQPPNWQQPASASQQALTPEKVATIKKEVAAHMEQYYRWYSEKNTKAMGTENYLNPSLGLQANGPELRQTDKRIADMAKMAAQAGDKWTRYEYPNPVICVLNPSAAIVSGGYTSYRPDGSTAHSGGTYLLSRTAEGWRVAVYVPQAKEMNDKVVRCD